MKYLLHGIIIFLLFILFLWIFGGGAIMYYGVWCVVLVLQVFMLVTGTDLTKILKKDTAYLNGLKDENGKLDMKHVNDEVAENVKSKTIKYLTIMIISFGVLFWQFLGLFSTNWFIFLSLFLLGFFIHLPITKIFKERVTFLRWFNRFWSIWRIGIIIFAIINAFNYQIDTFQWFLNLFS